MLSCKQASFLITQSLMRKLTFTERMSLRVHTLICKLCSRFQQQMIHLHATFKQIRQQYEQDASIHLPDEARSRIQQSLFKSTD